MAEYPAVFSWSATVAVLGKLLWDGVTLSVPFLARLAREVPLVRYFKIEVPFAAAKLRSLIEVGGEAIVGPFDGEEAIRTEWTNEDSLYGSKHLANRWKADGTLKRLKGLINVDMIGDKQPFERALRRQSWHRCSARNSERDEHSHAQRNRHLSHDAIA